MMMHKIQIIQVEQLEDLRRDYTIYHRYRLIRDDHPDRSFEIGVDCWYTDLNNRFHQIDREMDRLTDRLETCYAVISNWYEVVQNIKEIERKRYNEYSNSNSMC